LYEQLPVLELKLNQQQLNSLNKVWPGPTSVIIDCESEEMAYLHRGAKSLAVRMPDNKDLLELIRMTGPLVATSANVAGQPTPTRLEDIRQQLPGMDFYIDGNAGAEPSALMRLNEDGTIQRVNRA
jgi:L-threonylcarbamoyladenylate synthase